MSEAALTKIKNECSRIEKEIDLYKDSVPLTQACESIVAHIEKEVEPFSTKGAADANSWQAGGGGGGGCTIA